MRSQNKGVKEDDVLEATQQLLERPREYTVKFTFPKVVVKSVFEIVHGAVTAYRVGGERHVRLFARSDSAEERGLRYPHVVASIDRGT